MLLMTHLPAPKRITSDQLKRSPKATRPTNQLDAEAQDQPIVVCRCLEKLCVANLRSTKGSMRSSIKLEKTMSGNAMVMLAFDSAEVR